MKWRLVLSPEEAGIYLNMGIDEAVMNAVREGIYPPTLRFWRISDRAVSIGVHQSVERECNLDFCEANGILVSRRISGGGSVYKDGSWELNYSLVLRVDESVVPSDIRESHRVLCGGLIYGLKRMGLNAEMVLINDIAVGGRKVSGNAQARKRGVILNHGTMLVGVDSMKMFRALRVPEVPEIDGEDAESRAMRLSSRVISLEELLSRDVAFGEVVDALVHGFEEALGVDFVKQELSAAEMEEAELLSTEKYSTHAWNFKR